MPTQPDTRFREAADHYKRWRTRQKLFTTETAAFKRWLAEQAIPLLGISSHEDCSAVVTLLQREELNIVRPSQSAFETAARQAKGTGVGTISI